MTGRGIGVAVVVATLGVGVGAESVAARPHPHDRPFVSARLDRSLRTDVLRTNQIGIRAGSSHAAIVRLSISAGRVGVAAHPRSVRFTRAGSRRLRLGLTRAGILALRSCARVRIIVTARSRRLRRLQGRLRPSNSLVIRRTRRTFGAQRSRCRGGLIPLPPPLPAAGAPRYSVGVASRSINPGADGKYAGQPVYLGGYGIASPPADAGRPATGVLGDGVHVRAIAISDASRHTAAIADIEVQGWFAAQKDAPYGLVDMRKAVEKRTKGALKASDVIVQSDHSHSGPDMMGVWGGTPLGYRKYLFDQTVDAIVEAYDRRRAGNLYYGTAPGRDLLSNQFDYDAQNKVVDSDVRVLQARDDAGQPFATLLNFSAHATVLGSSNTKASGDWVQAANPLLSKRFGGGAVTVVGTLGRTQPADRSCPDKSLPKDSDAQSLCTINDYAVRVVDRAQQAADAATPITGAPVVAARSYLIEDVTSNPLLLGLLYGGAPVGAPLNRSETPPWLAGNVLGTVTGSIRIGDVLLSSVPGEAYPQIALRVRELVKGLRGYMTAGLADDQLGYLIAPYESYPEPIRRSFFNQRGDQVSPIDNDNYFFNVSQTMGERVKCSLLRGAGDLFGKGMAFRDADGRCAPFANDLALAPGADTK